MKEQENEKKKKKKKEGKTDFAIVLSDELYKELRLFCFEEHISMNKFINEAIAEKLIKRGVVL
jgi:predicted HicB family RNase H-like nuclease